MSDWDDATRLTSKSEIAKPARKRDQAFLIVIAGNNVGEMYQVTPDGLILGRGSDVPIRLFDDGVSRNHAQVVLDGSDVMLKDMGSSNGTFCNGLRVDNKVLTDGDKIQIGRTTILKFTYHDDLDEQFQQSLFDSALKDSLTGAFNKKYFLERMDSEIKFAHRHGSPFSLFLFDLDHFKAVNDTHGHLAGDKVLQVFSQTLIETLRKEDVFARYGGEEFALACRSISKADALVLGERLRGLIEAMDIEYDGIKIPVTSSIGLATLPELDVYETQAMIAAADKALYKSKHAGRNRITAA